MVPKADLYVATKKNAAFPKYRTLLIMNLIVPTTFLTHGVKVSIQIQANVLIKNIMFKIVFWDVLPCKIIVDRRFRGTYNYFTR
jgi:hypothetical protein